MSILNGAVGADPDPVVMIPWSSSSSLYRQRRTLRLAGSVLFHGMVTTISVAVLMMSIGCTGIAGGLAGAGVSGGVLGASHYSQTWPYEENPKVMQLDCDGDSIVLEASPYYALAKTSVEMVRLERVYYVDKKLRYGHVSRVAQNEQDMTVNEKDAQTPEFDWLVVLNMENVDLERDGVLIPCHIQDL